MITKLNGEDEKESKINLVQDKNIKFWFFMISFNGRLNISLDILQSGCPCWVGWVKIAPKRKKFLSELKRRVVSRSGNVGKSKLKIQHVFVCAVHIAVWAKACISAADTRELGNPKCRSVLWLCCSEIYHALFCIYVQWAKAFSTADTRGPGSCILQLF